MKCVCMSCDVIKTSPWKKNADYSLVDWATFHSIAAHNCVHFDQMHKINDYARCIFWFRKLYVCINNQPTYVMVCHFHWRETKTNFFVWQQQQITRKISLSQKSWLNFVFFLLSYNCSAFENVTSKTGWVSVEYLQIEWTTEKKIIIKQAIVFW